MKPTIIFISLIIFFSYSTTVQAQDNDTTLPEIELPVITLADGTDVEVTVDPDTRTSSVSFKYRGNTIYFRFGSDYGLTTRFAQGDYVPLLGSTGLLLTAVGPNTTPLDTAYLPSDYRDLWLDFIELCEILKQSQEFWDLVNSEIDNQEFTEMLDSEIPNMAVGLYFPQGEGQTFSISNSIGSDPWTVLPPARIYRIDQNYTVLLETSDEFLSENPDLYLNIFSNDPIDSRRLHLDPDTESCIISLRGGLWNLNQTSERDHKKVFSEVVTMLSLFREHIPSLAEDNLVPYPDDLLLIIDQAILGLTTYEILVEDPDPLNF